MPATPPLFSVVIPAYKAAAFISQTLHSVYMQTETDLEIIVVNDGSPDNTEEVLLKETDPRLRIITQPNGGECAARNRGVREARGTYVAFLDSDDAWLPDHLALARTFFEKHPDYNWYSTRPKRTPDIQNADFVPSSESFEGFWAVNWYLEGDAQTSSSSAVLRRSAIGSEDLFPVGVRMFGDCIGWCRFANKNRMIGTAYRTTALYRIWGGSATDAFLAASGGNKSGAGLDAFRLLQELFLQPDCPAEAKLFIQSNSLYNWWTKCRSTSLLNWLPEINCRKPVTGSILSLWLSLFSRASHFFAFAMGKIVRLKYNSIIRKQSVWASRTRQKLS